jgi:hypothetical protein
MVVDGESWRWEGMFMRQLTFDLFKSSIRESSNFEGKKNCMILAALIDKYVEVDEILEFYPKGLFVNEIIEALIFKKDSMLSFVTNGEHSVIKTFKYKNLTSVELTQSESNDRKKAIEIKFSDGTLYLQSDADTNDTWSNRFAEKISNIFKLIS